MTIVAFKIVCRAWNHFITEMYGEFVEILHHLLNVGAEFTRQVLDLVDHRFKPAKSYLVGRCSEDALEFAPDNRAVKLLRG